MTINYDFIRPDILASLQRYAEQGIPTGDFLRAVLANDLMEACGCADEDNQRTLFHIVAYVYNEMPSICHGSEKRVDCWIKEKREQLRREA